MKTPAVIFLLALSVLLSACESKDAKLQKSLLGSWEIKNTTPEGVKVEGKTTYLPEGKMQAKGTITFMGNAIPVEISGTWKVDKGYLLWTAQQSNFPKLFPVGYSSTDKIVSVTDTEYTYVDHKDGETKVEARVK